MPIDIVAAVVRRDGELLLVEAQSPLDPEPVWTLPAGKVEGGETLVAALGRELAEETGLSLIAEPSKAFEVEVTAEDDGAGAQRWVAVTFEVGAAGELRPADPDGLILSACWVPVEEALARLAGVQWYECEPLRRYLSGAALPGARYRYRVGRTASGFVRGPLEQVATDRT